MNQPTTQPPAPTCAGCAHQEPGCAYCSLLGERRKASDTACGQRSDGKVQRTDNHFARGGNMVALTVCDICKRDCGTVPGLIVHVAKFHGREVTP